MSVVNEDFRHVFIHVPKTGGTSMEGCPWVGGNGHATISQLCQRSDRRFIRWAFVRNPFDRAVSTYEAFRQHGGKAHKWASEMTFPQRVRWLHSSPATQMRFSHTKPQAHYLTVGGAVAVDFLGRFELIDTHWEAVQKMIGVEPMPLEKSNATDHADWKTYMDAATEGRLMRMYRQDFDLFGY